MEQRKLGALDVPAIGLGCMGMSAFYGTTDEGEALATIDRALELGCNLLDTAEMYGPYVNEELVAKAIAGRRERFVVATKFGVPGRFKICRHARRHPRPYTGDGSPNSEITGGF